MSDQRLCHWAMLAAMRTQRQSARRGRPISLPNLLRLFQRQCADGGGPNSYSRAYRRLETWYRQRQPFKKSGSIGPGNSGGMNPALLRVERAKTVGMNHK